MLQRTVALLILFLGMLAGSSDNAPLFADEPLKNPDAELEAIIKEWSKANTKDKFEPYGERCFQLVEAYPRSSAATRALVFVVGKTPNTPQAQARGILMAPPAKREELALQRVNSHRAKDCKPCSRTWARKFRWIL